MREYLEKKIFAYAEELDATVDYKMIESVVVEDLKRALNDMVKEKKIMFTREDNTIYFSVC